MMPFPSMLLGSAAPYAPTGALIARPESAQACGAVVAQSYSVTEFDELGWKIDNQTLEVPAGQGIGLIRLFGSHYVSNSLGRTFAHRQWDGAAYTGFVGRGLARKVASGDNGGSSMSAILAVTGGERFQHWKEDATACSSGVGQRNSFGVEVLDPGTRYTFARRASTQAFTATNRATILWNASDIADTLGSHDPVGNPGEFIVPADTTGKLRVQAQGVVVGLVTGQIGLFISHNGSDVAVSDCSHTAGAPDVGVVSHILSVAPGDIIRIDALCTANMSFNGAAAQTWACIEELPASHRYCLVRKNVRQAMANASPISIQWDGADSHDPENLHDPASNNTRLLVPPGANEAKLSWSINFDNAAAEPMSWGSTSAGRINGLPCDEAASTLTDYHSVMGLWLPCAGLDYFTVVAATFNGTATGVNAATTTWAQAEFR